MPQSKGEKKFRFVILILIFLFLTTFNNNQNFLSFFFKIKNISFNKTLYLEESLKFKIINILNGDSLFFFNENKIRALIMQSNWANKIEFKRIYPSDLIINIKEFYPVAYFKENDKIYLINSGFSKSSIDTGIDLAKIIKLNKAIDLKKLESFYQVLRINSFLLNKIFEINYLSDSRWDVVLADKKLVKFGRYDLHEQISKLKQFINNPNIQTIDFRIKNRITVSYVK